MTIDEAILLQDVYLRNPLCNLRPEEKEAIQLGREALNRLKTLRTGLRISAAAPLPSETED